MLEIICLMWLWRKNGRLAASKGQNPRKYQWLTLALWFGMEFSGCFAGALIMALLFPNENAFTGAYVLGCVGACIGGYMSYVAAKNAPEAGQGQNPWSQQQNPWSQQQNPWGQSQNPWNQQPNLWDQSQNSQGYGVNYGQKNEWSREANEEVVKDENVLESPATIHIISEKGGYEGCQDSFFLNGEPVCMLGPESDYAFSTNVKKNTITIGKPQQTADDAEHCVRFIAAERGYIEIHTAAGKMIPEKFKNFM